MNWIADLLSVIHEAECERQARIKEKGMESLPVSRENWERVVMTAKGVAMTVLWNLPPET